MFHGARHVPLHVRLLGDARAPDPSIGIDFILIMSLPPKLRTTQDKKSKFEVSCLYIPILGSGARTSPSGQTRSGVVRAIYMNIMKQLTFNGYFTHLQLTFTECHSSTSIKIHNSLT